MNSLLGIACLAAMGIAFAKDPNQPVSRGSAEFSGGVTHARYTGSFNSSGKYVAYPDSLDLAPAGYIVPLRLRLGLGKGFETRVDWSYANANKDAGSKQGFGQPSFRLSYTGKNLGVFGTVSPPLATGDFDNGQLRTYVEAGGILRMKSPHFRATTLLSHINDFDDKQILRLWFKPEVVWRQGFSSFVTVEWLKDMNEEAWLSTLGPGIRVDFSEEVGVEVTAPFSIAGRNSPVAGWSVGVRGLWTLKF